MSRCDFCSSTEAVCLYPARDFTAWIVAVRENGEVSTAEWRSRGAWHACNACRGQIDADARDELTERVTRIYAARRAGPVDDADLRDSLASLHEAFWQHREGPAREL